MTREEEGGRMRGWVRDASAARQFHRDVECKEVFECREPKLPTLIYRSS